MTALATTVVIAVVAGEVAARSAINDRLSGHQGAHFSGHSALAALITDRTQITFDVGPERLANSLRTRLGNKAAARAEVVLSDGEIGIKTTIHSREAVAWFSLDTRAGDLEATPLSVELAGIQVAPGLLFGRDPIEIPNPIGEQCDLAIDDVAIHSSGVALTVTIKRSDVECLKKADLS